MVACCGGKVGWPAVGVNRGGLIWGEAWWPGLGLQCGSLVLG